jgi:phosphopantothenoylcysteine decarboxylase/phosphopantothenate--cysteine ligase
MDNLKEIAEKKLKESHTDAIIANDISRKDRGFESDNNEVLIILKNGKTKHIPLTSKNEVAREIVSYISDNI